MPTGFQLTERDYRYLFENASDAMWVHDMDGRFLDANHAFAKLIGYTLKDWAGLNVTQFLAPGSLATARDVRERLLRGTDKSDVAIAPQHIDVCPDVVSGGDGVKNEVEAEGVFFHLVSVL